VKPNLRRITDLVRQSIALVLTSETKETKITRAPETQKKNSVRNAPLMNICNIVCAMELITNIH